MHTIDLTEFRRRSYAVAMRRVLVECNRLGVANLWDTDLRTEPRIRAAALSGCVGSLACHLDQARHFATLAGFGDVARLLATRGGELQQLGRDATTRPVSNTDKGRKGRGVKIRGWIKENKGTWQQVARRFDLAESTARRYVREANKKGSV